MPKHVINLIVFAAPMAMLLAGCSGDGDSDLPTKPQRKVSLEEYLTLCGSANEVDPSITTNQQMAEALAEILAELKAVIPPAEVAAWHNQFLVSMKNMQSFFDRLPAEEEISFGSLLAAAAGAMADMEEVEADLTDEIRLKLAEAECLVGEAISVTIIE